MRKTKGLWIVIIIVLAVMLLVLYFRNKSNQAIFSSSYVSTSNGFFCNGYIIYLNGIIEEENTNKNKNNLKSNKISKEELKELKELIKTIKEQYEEKTLQKHEIVIDGGSTTKSIYSDKMNKWIILSSSSKINSSENCIEILSLTEELYNKYLK